MLIVVLATSNDHSGSGGNPYRYISVGYTLALSLLVNTEESAMANPAIRHQR